MTKTMGECVYCGKTFANPKEARAHVYKEHPKKVQEMLQSSKKDRESWQPVRVYEVFGKESRYREGEDK